MTPSNSQHKDVSVLIPAAGKGERLGLGPKALLELAGKPLIYWVTKKALSISNDVVIAIPPGSHTAFVDFCPDCRFVEGGTTRRESITRLVNSSGRDFVLIHAIAFPFASLRLLQTVLNEARNHGAAASFLKLDAPLAKIEHAYAIEELWQTQGGLFQAPQAYKTKLLVQAIGAAENIVEQSTVNMLLKTGMSVAAVAGEKTNIKITDSVDWLFAQSLKTHLV